MNREATIVTSKLLVEPTDVAPRHVMRAPAKSARPVGKGADRTWEVAVEESHQRYVDSPRRALRDPWDKERTPDLDHVGLLVVR